MLKIESSHPTLIIFGPQGSGKSTQAERAAEKFNLTYLDFGEALRQSAQTDPKIADMLKSGQLVSDEVVGAMVDNFLKQNYQKKGFILDGFPRKLSQCAILDELVKKYNLSITGVYIQIADKTALQRLAIRFKIIDGKKVSRQDDTPEVVAKRLATFKEVTQPVADYLKEHYQLIEIDGEPDRDSVTKSVNNALEPIVHD